MARTKIAFQMELVVDDPALLPAALKSIAAGLVSDPATQSAEMIAEDGSLRWQVQSWGASDLVICAGCGREVPRSECDITPDGSRCSKCSLAGDVEEHFEEALTNAYERGRLQGRSKMSDFLAPWFK